MSAYTFRAAGTWSTTGSPGDPAGKTAGDLLLLYASARLSTETINAAPTGWTLLFDTSTTAKEQLAIFGRIATGDASDTVSAHDFWSGTSYNICQIAAFHGDVWAGGLGSIVAHSVAQGSDSNVADLPHAALTVSTEDCLVIGAGVKQKTTTSNGAAITDPAWVDTRIGGSVGTGSSTYGVWGFTQQTTATNISASSWTQSIAESMHYASMVLALKTEPAASVATITDVSATSVADGISIVITGTNFGASQGASTLKLETADGAPSVTQTAVAWADTEITFVAETTALPFGAIVLELVVGATTLTEALTLVSATGYANGVANVTWPVGAVSVFDGASPAVVDGDLYEYEVTTDLGASVEVLVDGTFVINSQTGTHSFDVRVYDQTDETWSAWTTAVVQAADSAGYSQMSVRTVYALPSVAGLRCWVDYIPVKVVVPNTDDLGTFNDDGGLYTIGLTSVVGKIAWVDYVPVYVIAGVEGKQWRTDDDGWIPVSDV